MTAEIVTFPGSAANHAAALAARIERAIRPEQLDRIADMLSRSESLSDDVIAWLDVEIARRRRELWKGEA